MCFLQTDDGRRDGAFDKSGVIIGEVAVGNIDEESDGIADGMDAGGNEVGVKVGSSDGRIIDDGWTLVGD